MMMNVDDDDDNDESDVDSWWMTTAMIAELVNESTHSDRCLG